MQFPVFDLPWWGYVLVVLALTHVTIAAVTIYLHRCQAHRALDLHPAVSHFFRFWLWLTTGMITKEWAAIHRKHHAKCETAEDPHSPQVLGINRVLWGGVFLYVKESRVAETMERYGHGTPDDWIERRVYTPLHKLGILVMLTIDVALFGWLAGALVWGVQMIWIPFWAAGVINGIGHYWGYRHFEADDASRNIVPWGILIGGEELHNNHHAYPTSARLSNRWYEFDLGWLYIRTMAMLRLARVKKVAPRLHFQPGKTECDATTLQAVITHRYEVMTKYAKSLRHTWGDEIEKLRIRAELSRSDYRRIKRWINVDPNALSPAERARFEGALACSKVLQTVYSMRQELTAVWARSSASRDQLVKQLEDWCRRAEASGIAPLQDFSRTLRCYA